jgi:hypothetical protein
MGIRARARVLTLDVRAHRVDQNVETWLPVRSSNVQQGAVVLIVLDNVKTWEPRPGPLPEVAAIQMLVTTRRNSLTRVFHDLGDLSGRAIAARAL